MSNRDEFDDLIKNFKLDEIDDSQLQKEQVRRPMFDYEGDLHRASRPQASKQEYTPPRQAASSAAPAGAQRPRAMAASGVGNAQMHHDTKVQGGKKRREKILSGKY